MQREMTAWDRLKNTVLPIDAIRRVDQVAVDQFGMNSLVLMENAGLGCVAWLSRRFSKPQRTVILCGRGNNGGDGLVVARHLQVLGWPIYVGQWGPESKLSADASANFNILSSDNAGHLQVLEESSPESAHHQLLRNLQDADVIIDAMLGTGATGDPREPLSQWITAANQQNAFRVALDNPTGIDATSGKRYSPAFQADATLSFVCLKPAMAQQDRSELFGEIAVLPIGIPDSLITHVLQQSGSEEA